MNSDITPDKPVVIVGAGIVGVCCAAYLVREGVPVLLVDRRGAGEATSFGNLGGIQTLAATPLSLPGILKEVVSWIGDSEGPLHIRPSYLPRAAPWLWKFWRQSRLDRVWHNARALDSLNSHCVSSLMPLVRWAGLDDLIEVPGQLYLWTSRQSYDKSTLSRAIWASTGHAFSEIGPDEIRELEPALSPAAQVGLRIPGNGYCRDPYRLTRGLADKAMAEGGRFVQADVSGFIRDGDRISGVRTDRGVLPAGAVIVASGAWSQDLARSLGHRVPLETQRGYHVTIADPGVRLRHMCLVIDRKVAITPMAMGLRIGGSVEFAGLAASPDYRRAEAFLRLGRSLVKGLEAGEHTEWMGHRPCLPDSLPVIGPSPALRNVQFAFGHGHMGLIGSAPTGRALADLVLGRAPSFDLAPFSIERFGQAATPRS